MEFNFVPKHLIESKNEIIAKHSNIGQTRNVQNNYDFMKLVKYLADIDKEKIYGEALILTNKEMKMIAGYLPHNFYKVRLENLFQIFLLRTNLQLNKILFYEWQNSFDIPEFNAFLQILLRESGSFKEIIEGCHLTEQKFSAFLRQENIPIAYGKEIMSLESLKSQTFKDRLKYIGIRSTSRLSKECEFIFFVFCGKNDYLEIGDKELVSVIDKYNDKLKKQFLLNFLEKLSMEELNKFQRLAEYFLKLTGENHSERFYHFFTEFNSILVRKYIDWTNTYKIHKIFKNDERSVFWEKYHHELVVNYTFSDSVVMEFENYIAVEFLGKAMGPLYVYKKEYFDKYIRNSFAHNLFDNSTLRSYLLNETEYVKNAMHLRNITGTRLVHNPNPGWQSKFDRLLLENNITERIRNQG